MCANKITRSQFGDQLQSLIDSISEHIVVVGECWEYSPRYKQTNYGRAYFRYERFTAHRLIFAIVFGEIAADLLVCHRCDNPPCVRPHHLFEGTDADNHHDKVMKGRNFNPMDLHPECARKGEAHPFAKLTETKVREIRQRYALGNTSYAALGREFEVDHTSIRDVVKLRKWKHVV